MKQLNKPGDNMGGLLRIWAVPPSVISISGSTASMSSTTNVIAIYATPGTIGFSEKEVSGKPGQSYDIELVAVTPKDSQEARDILDLLDGRRWVVIYLDQNEQYKVIGTPETGLRVSTDLNTGKDTSDMNAYTLKFYGQQPNRAVFVGNPFEE